MSFFVVWFLNKYNFFFFLKGVIIYLLGFQKIISKDIFYYQWYNFFTTCRQVENIIYVYITDFHYLDNNAF